jgi:tetratricopeptide (TPR) repeat protein
MKTTRLRAFLATAVFAAAGAIGLAADPPSDEKLKDTALKLNELADEKDRIDKVRELAKDKAAAKRLVKLAAEVHKAGKEKDSPYKFHGALALAEVAHAVKDYPTAETFYKFAADTSTKLSSGSKMITAYFSLIDVYNDQKKYAEVEEVAKKLIDMSAGREFEQAKPLFLEKLVQAKAHQGDTDEALRMVEGLMQLDMGGWYFLQLKGWVQREAGKYDDAISTYEDVLEKVKDQKGLPGPAKANVTRQIRYTLSGLYVDNKNVDKAAEQLQKLMKDNPEIATFYNDLGFIWADNDKNLDEAEKLIRKAIEMEAEQRKKLLKEGKIDEETAKKDNAAYVDSLGWVLYKKKKFEEAVKYLREAAKDEEDGNHIEIWDHLADALVATGNKKEAVEIWEKSLKLDDVSKRDVERRKKVNEKLKKMKAELAK